MSALETVAGWLRCPVCGDGLVLSGRTLTCPRRHSFDLAKQGYANLLGQTSPKNADTPDMVAARERFLGAGWYAPITAAVAEAVTDRRAILEVGAGTGHHLAGALPHDAHGLATDVSVPACKRAARVHPRVAAVVADTWARLPVRDGAVDAVLCVFAPRNLEEFRRVLAPGGIVVVVVPNQGHLAGLREQYGLLDIAEHKVEQVAASLTDAATKRVAFDLDLDAASATDLVAMGPNAFHGAGALPATTVSVDVSVVVGSLGADPASET